MSADRPRARLFVPVALAPGARLTVSEAGAHYLATVLRLAAGDAVSLFNGHDGEWIGRLLAVSRRAVTVEPVACARLQQPEPGPWLAFAPVKKSALDVLVEKATELGVERLLPVLTARTVVTRVNVGRLSAQVQEAAEQCERLTLPTVAEPVALAVLSAGWPPDRPLWVLDERGSGTPVAAMLEAWRTRPAAAAPGILVGPEGGFASSELDALSALPFVSRVSLGPRILRAETAALAALASWQAIAGDGWKPPAHRPDRPASRTGA